MLVCTGAGVFASPRYFSLILISWLGAPVIAALSTCITSGSASCCVGPSAGSLFVAQASSSGSKLSDFTNSLSSIFELPTIIFAYLGFTFTVIDTGSVLSEKLGGGGMAWSRTLGTTIDGEVETLFSRTLGTLTLL